MSNTHVISLKRSTALLVAVTFLSLLTVVNFSALFGNASAADLTDRSLALSSTLVGTETAGAAGSATNGSAATHTFVFTAETASTSVTLEYCENAVGTCVPSSVDLAAATGSTGTFTDSAANTGSWTGVTVNAGTASTLVLQSVENPTAVGTFFVRIATGDGDEGTVASAITEGIEITARVAETLGFSTTGQFGGAFTPAPTASCVPLTGVGAITLGDPVENTLDLTQAYDNYSAFRLYTNAAGGVEVQYHGDTLTRTAGGDIDAIGATALNSAVAEEQFGLAIDLSVGGNAAVPIESSASTLDMTNVTTSANLALDGALTPDPEYGTGEGTITDGGAALFAFAANTPTTIASTTGYTECKTAAVRYIANISPTTTSGTYTTTVVYSAVPTY